MLCETCFTIATGARSDMAPKLSRQESSASEDFALFAGIGEPQLDGKRAAGGSAGGNLLLWRHYAPVFVMTAQLPSALPSVKTSISASRPPG